MDHTLRFWAGVSLVAAATIAVAVASDGRVLTPNLGVTVYPDGRALVQVPYRRDGLQGAVSIRLQGNEVVSDFPAQPRKHWNNNYFVATSGDLPERVQVEVTFAGPDRTQLIRRTVRPTRVLSVTSDGADTSAVAAAAMVALAKRNSADDKLPANASTMVTELTTDLRGGFVVGLNLWARKKGLPVHTAQLGDAAGRTTLDALEVALERGDTAQLMMDGRMVNLVGIVRNDDVFLLVDEPHGPMGTTVYRAEDVRVGLGFSQRWCGVVHCP